jgi:hypothetical protein
MNGDHRGGTVLSSALASARSAAVVDRHRRGMPVNLLVPSRFTNEGHRIGR